MRNPTTHKFLAWAGPTAVLFVGGCLALVATFAQTYDGVKNWAQKLFDQWWPVVSAPWFLVAGVVVICAYVWALVWTGQDRKPKPKSGIWLYGEGLENVEVSREASGPFEAKFFPLPQHNGLVDQLIAAKNRSHEAAMARKINPKKDWQRELITQGRNIAFGYTYEKPEEGFRAYLEGHRAYADIRPHLSEEYRAKLHAQRTLYAQADGAKYETLVQWFLDEIDRLEREWFPTRNTVQIDARPDVPDAPMWQAVQYVASALGDDDEQGCYAATLRAVRQAASQGRIEIWGKRELEAPSQRGNASEIWTPIEASYWANHKINSMATGEMWDGHDHSYGEPLNIHAQDRYFSLRVRWREIARQWPRSH